MNDMFDYLGEFSKHYVQSQLQGAGSEPATGNQGECYICETSIKSDEQSLLLGCNHCYHLECLRPSVKVYLEQEKIDLLISCSCKRLYTPEELAKIVSSPEEALRIQKALVRTEPSLKFCPGCGEGITKYNSCLGFAYHCQQCDRDLCFSCGKEPHHGYTCSELNTDDGAKRRFIQELIESNQASNYGLCPYCNELTC